jgi:hypothetical protein
MSGSRRPFRGRLRAAGFLFDPFVVTAANTADRIREYWIEGARLLDIDGCLALVLPGEISVRAELAPGHPITRAGERLSVLRHGQTVELVPSDLPEADLTRLVDLSNFTVAVVEPVPAVEEIALAPLVETPVEKPDLRRASGIGPATGRLARGRRELESLGGATGESAGPKRERPGKGLLAKAILKSPAGGLVGRRHARYVAKLTERFDSKDWDTALRSAISLGGKGGALSLGLPKMRARIAGPGNAQSRASSSVPYGANIQVHLSNVYREAAQQLEREGQLMLAAFVHSDLLANPLAAVELLERNGEFKTAAELAEGWTLEPALIVRLWWLAGDKERALRIARARGAFAAAIQRLAKSDTEAERSLRREWMLERRTAQDHLGAVQAAWPDQTLRDNVMPDIAAGIAQGGALSGTLLAHLLNHSTNPDAYAVATHLLDEPDVAAADARSAFRHAFADLPAADPTQDRHLASIALLETLNPDPATSRRAVFETQRAFRARADPLLVADLPPVPTPSPPASPEPLELEIAGTGQVPLHDAIAIGHDTILVALGDQGVRLLTHAGKVRARWDVPAHRIIVADHGNRVVLAADRSGVYSLHELDLPISKPRPLPPIRASYPLDTYDGTRLVTLSSEGLRWLEPEGDRWRVAWQELNDGTTHFEDANRVADSLAVLFWDTSGDRHVWQWEVPSVALRHRRVLKSEDDFVLATGHTVQEHGTSEESTILWRDAEGRALSVGPVSVSSPYEVLAMGRGYVIVEHPDERTQLRIYAIVEGPELAKILIEAGGQASVRAHGAYVTIADPRGHVVVLDAERREVIADFFTSV